MSRPLLVKRVFVGVIAICIMASFMVHFVSVFDWRRRKLRPRSRTTYENAFQVYSERRRDIQKSCHLHPKLKRPFTADTVNQMIVDPVHRIMFCPAGKAASTFWKQILEVSSGIFNNSNPLEVYDEGYKRLYYLKKLNPAPQKVAIRCFKSFFFTRHPLSRIWSAFNDKLYMANYYYWDAWGTAIVKQFRQNATKKSATCGHDVTFNEFIKFLLHIFHKKLPSSTDTHISPISSQCMPCSVNYTYVGKLDTLVKDVSALLPVLGMENKIVFSDLKRQYEEQSIADLVHRNLNWHSRYQKIKNCISQSDLIGRIWKYSQNVGNIDFLAQPPEMILGRSDVTIEEMKQALLTTRSRSGVRKEFKQYQTQVMKNAYATVSSADMERLIDIYRLDFEMFGYEPVP